MARQAYLAKKGSGTYAPLSTTFDGLRILSVTGMDGQGKPVNVFTAQWMDGQAEDFAIGNASGTVVTENVNIEVTFIVGDKYATSNIDVRRTHDAFIAFITKGDLYLKSLYEEKEVHCVCLDEYKPTQTRLCRGRNGNFMMGTVKLHALDAPTDTSVEPENELYIGFGGASIGSVSDIENLTNVQHSTPEDVAGGYSINAATTSYLWICSTELLNTVTSSGFEVPMEGYVQIGDFLCYRSSNSIASGNMQFVITT